jgi:chromosome segregation ATPase
MTAGLDQLIALQQQQTEILREQRRAFDGRFDSLNANVTRCSERLASLESRVEGMASQLDTFGRNLHESNQFQHGMNEHIAAMHVELAATSKRLSGVHAIVEEHSSQIPRQAELILETRAQLAATEVQAEAATESVEKLQTKTNGFSKETTERLSLLALQTAGADISIKQTWKTAVAIGCGAAALLGAILGILQAIR